MRAPSLVPLTGNSARPSSLAGGAHCSFSKRVLSSESPKGAREAGEAGETGEPSDPSGELRTNLYRHFLW